MTSHQKPLGTKSPLPEGASRRRRFQRSPKGKVKNPTEFDRDIFQHLHNARFLSTDDICDLLEGERNRLYIQTRLTELFHDAWIDRPDAQQELQKIRGTSSLILAIAGRAARILGVPAKNNQGLEVDSLVHDHMIGSFYVRVLTAIKKISDVELTCWEREAKGPSVWVPEAQKRLYLSPDARLELRREEDVALFFLEAETGSVPGWRKNFTRSSYWRKLGFYTALWKQYRKDYPSEEAEYKTFAVLTVVPQEKREHLAYLIDLCREHDLQKRGLGIFWFTTMDLISTKDPLHDPIWQKADLNQEGMWTMVPS